MAVKEIACARLIAAHRSERHAAIYHNRAAFVAYQRLAKPWGKVTCA